MALQGARYTAIHNETGSDKDKLKDEFDAGYAQKLAKIPDKEPLVSAIMYQLGLMQEELDYLRTEISANKDKTGITTAQANAITANTAKTSFPGFGTSSTTALAGDTTTISTAQAREISRSTIHNTKLDIATPANLSKSTAITFGEFTTTGSGKTLAYSLPITVTETTVTNKGSVTLTKTGSITLT